MLNTLPSLSLFFELSYNPNVLRPGVPPGNFYLPDQESIMKFPNKVLYLFAAFAASCATALPAFAAEPLKGDLDAAKSKVSMCIGCHGIVGYRSSFPEIYSVPKIAGQNDKYIQSSLRAYASGERTHPTMTVIAKSLSDQDIADLGAYYSNLK